MIANPTILISGGSGLLGSALIEALRPTAARIYCTTRSARTENGAVRYIKWDGASPLTGLPPRIDIAVNLAGENIGARRWSARRKKLIIESRVDGTKRLVTALSQIEQPPTHFLSASGVGYYGEQGSKPLDETSGRGSGFLAEVCADWEEAAHDARRFGAIVTTLRFGVVMAANGGALQKMVLPFRLGLGGTVGGGAQYMSWISLADAASALIYAIEHPLDGALNLCSPGACTNREFTSALAAALRRPAVIPLPRWAVSLLFGQMGRELLLTSARVEPKTLTTMGFQFSDREIQSCLKNLFSK